MNFAPSEKGISEGMDQTMNAVPEPLFKEEMH